MTNSSKFSGKDVTKKDKSMEHVLREELELVSVAASELTKLKRQLRQTKSELKSWQLNNKKTVERQEKAIRLLEKEKKDCQIKWTAIKEAQKPPTTAINVLVDKYHKTVQQLDDIKCQLQTAKEELNQAENKRHNRGQPVGVDRSQCSFKVQDAQHKLDQVMIQYNKILASNLQSRLQLQEMLRIKEEFGKHLKQLEKEHEQVSSGLDKLYEETTSYYQQREEFRLKLNLLHERLEKTKTQGQREIREYRRLLNNDEKLNHFLAQKNKTRNNVDEQQDSEDVLHNACEEQMTQKDVQEWLHLFTQHFGHGQFETVIDQYLHDLEHGYVLYGLIAQKNNEIDQLEDTISHLEKQLEPSATCDVTQSVNHVVAKLQNILHTVDLQFHLTQEGSSLLVRCQLGCDLLSDRITSLLSLIAKSEKSELRPEKNTQKSDDSLEDPFSFELPSIDDC